MLQNIMKQPSPTAQAAFATTRAHAKFAAANVLTPQNSNLPFSTSNQCLVFLDLINE